MDTRYHEQEPLILSSGQSSSDIRVGQKQGGVLLPIVVFAAVLSVIPLLMVAYARSGSGLVLGIIAALIAAVLIVRWPVSGLYIITGCVALVEQSPLAYPVITDRLNIYYWPPSLAGLPERPIGFLFLFILAVIILHRLSRRQSPLAGGKLLVPFLLYLLAAIFGVVHGLASGGDVKIIVVQFRPFWYLFVSYIMAYNLVTQKNHIRNVLWIIIIAAAIKGLQGAYIYFFDLHTNLNNVNEIMSHEESFFFVALLLLVIAFCLHYRYRPQLYAALLGLPAVFIALIANQRRADYIALLAGILVVWVILLVVKPRARAGLIIGFLICAALGAGYVAAFAHSSGGFAQPARAILSVIKPDTTDSRDAASNLYRIFENADLKATANANPMGLGFGKQFLEPFQLPNIITLDPYYQYVPHNTIYWIWADLGPQGYFALWFLFGAIIVRGCLVARKCRDPYLQLITIYIVAITVMEVIVAFADYQLFFYRNVMYIGLLAGILMRIPTLDAEKEQVVHESTRSMRESTTTDRGSERTQLPSFEGARQPAQHITAGIGQHR